MKEYKYIRLLLLLVVGSLLTLVSCKDDEEDNGEPVTIVTGNLKNITFDSAVCGGEIITGYAKDRGVCWNTSPMPTVENSHTTDGNGAGEFTSSLTGLKEGTAYYVRAYARNGAGEIIYGEQKQCTTMAHGKPVTSINEVKTIKTTTAVVVSQMLIDGGIEVSDYGIIYGESEDLSLEKGTVVKLDVSKDPEETALAELTDNTKYYVIAYATYSGGTVYSASSSFTTLKYADPVLSLTTDNITGDSFDAEVTATSGTELPILEYGVVYGTKTKPTVEKNTVKKFGEGDGTVKSEIADLDGDTKYYVRPYAKNKNGVSYGEETTVLTLSNKALISTVATAHITAHRAFIGGKVLSLGLKSVPVTEVGICWGTKTAPTVAGDHVKADASFNKVGEFDALQLFCLVPSTKYYVRAYVTNQYGTNYGEEVTFTTREPVANYLKATKEGNDFNAFNMTPTYPGEGYSEDQQEAYDQLEQAVKSYGSRILKAFRFYIVPNTAGEPAYLNSYVYYSNSAGTSTYNASWKTKIDLSEDYVYTFSHSVEANKNATTLTGKVTDLTYLMRSAEYVTTDSFVIDWDNESSTTIAPTDEVAAFYIIPIHSPEKYKRMGVFRATPSDPYTDWW